MCNFKVGQKVVSLGSIWEYRRNKVKANFGPKKGEIVTVDAVIDGNIFEDGNEKYIVLREYKSSPIDASKVSFKASHFKPLVYSGDSSKEILEKFIPQESKADVPIQKEHLAHDDSHVSFSYE